MPPKKILIIVTSASVIGPNNKATGYWLDEAITPYYACLDAGLDIRIASPKGGNAPVDAESLKTEAQTDATRRYAQDGETQTLFHNTQILADLDATDFAGFFFAGGHGAMVDFPTNPHIIALIQQAVSANKAVASVCHGPACFVGVKQENGLSIMCNRAFTCFSDAEEMHIEQQDTVPFLLESTLCKQGAKAQNAGIFAENIVIDGPIITGQNPASALGTAQAMMAHAKASQSK
jgi:putative intracellular protease/amidase